VIHAFLLFVYLGLGEEKRLVSNDMYFEDLERCTWFAQKLHKQGQSITAFCLPKFVNSKEVRVY
jgi:hypothetical protein